MNLISCISALAFRGTAKIPYQQEGLFSPLETKSYDILTH